MQFKSAIPVRGRKLTLRHKNAVLGSTIPVRGRKRRCLARIIEQRCTIPVRGRKPVHDCVIMWPVCTIPVRGRKLNLVQLFQNLHRTIPVRGQKTPHQKKMRSFSFTNLNFLFSVGCPSMNGTIAAAVIFSLLRLLHGDKMCYNKANSKHLLQN